MAAYPQTLWLPPPDPYAIEDIYHTPAGYRDFPFIYMFNVGAVGIPGAAPFLNNRVLMDGTGEFILRSIFGFNGVLNTNGQFQFRNGWNSYCSSKPMYMAPGLTGATGSSGVIAPTIPAALQPFGQIYTLENPYTWQVVPEKHYPLDGQITFDLYNVALSATTPFTNILGFSGVKRLPIRGCFYDTPYKYKELPYSYQMHVTVSQAALGSLQPSTYNPSTNGPTSYQINIADYDFELQRILAQITAPNPLVAAIPYDMMAMTVYDATGVQTSSLPVPLHYLTDNGLFAGGSGSTSTGVPGSYLSVNASGMVFPSPPLVYPNQGRLRFDVWSNAQWADANLPYTVELVFQGVQRLPCS